MKLSQKLDNWEQIAKVLRNHGFILTREEYEPIVNYAPNSALNFLKRLYEYFTNREFKETAQKDADVYQMYHYLKPTATMLSRNRELTRIVDEHQKRFRTEDAIARHKEQHKNDLKQISTTVILIEITGYLQISIIIC